MGLFDWFKKKQEPTAPLKRTVSTLQVNDIVTYDLEDYIVIGKITYHDSGYEWVAYQLKGDQKNIWLAVELDDELELGIYQDIRYSLQQVPKEITIDGEIYYQEEHGTARITEAVGRVGASLGQTVEYWDFESDNDTYLSVERWAGEIEVSRGYPITEKELKILAGS